MEINLVGQPSVHHVGSEPYRPRSRKTWAVLGYLVLSERPPSRSHLSSLLFTEADDPLRALRWTLTELRRVLGPTSKLGGDPIELVLPPDVTVDVQLIRTGNWKEAIGLPRLGDDLLAGLESVGSPEFESWLLAERRYVASSTEDVLHEAVLGLLARGEPDEALRLAVSLVGLNPYRESHQALLIRAYLTLGDAVAAERQFEACRELFVRELGVVPGPAIRAVMQSDPVLPPPGGDLATFDAIMEAGVAATSAGAADAGVGSLRSAVALADSLGDSRRSINARLALANAVFRSIRGDDEEGAMILHEAAEMAQLANEDELYATARIELGYVDMLAARYDRAEHWLSLEGLAPGDEVNLARAFSYLGCMRSDRAEYGEAEELFDRAIGHSQAAGNTPLEAYATSLAGRMHFLRGDLESATGLLERAIELHDWFAFVPWPQTFLGEIALDRGDHELAERHLEQAFARASQIGDPCWEGVSGRGLGLLAAARGDTSRAFATLDDAADRCERRSDTYVWAKAYILDAQCTLGLAHSHQSTSTWITKFYDLVARTGMREFLVKALMHRTAFGMEDMNRAAINLAEEIDNPRLLTAVKSM